jgi:hypothetical protein
MGSKKRIVDRPFVATEEQNALVAEALQAFMLDVDYAFEIARRAANPDRAQGTRFTSAKTTFLVA